MIEQTLISLAFTRGQPKRLMMALTPKRLFISFSLFMSTSLLRLFSRAHYWSINIFWKANKTLDKDLQSLPTQTARYVSGRSRWKHNRISRWTQRTECTSHWSLRSSITLLLPQNMKKHLRVTSDEEKLVSLPCEWVLIDHGFRDRTLHPAHPLAKKSLKQLLTDPHEHSQTCFLYFRGRGIHWWGRFSCAVNESWRKIQVQTLHCSQQLLRSSAEQLNFDAQEAQYTTKTTTPVATEGDEEKKQNSEFSLVYFLALFLSRFKCAFCQRSLRQRRDALKSLLYVVPRPWAW